MKKGSIAFFHELPLGGARRGCNEFALILKREYDVDLYYIDEKKDAAIADVYDDAHFFKFIPKKWSGKDWKTKLYKDTIELYKLYRLHKKIAKQINQKSYTRVFVHGSKYTQAPFLLRFLSGFTAYYCQEPLRIGYEDYFAIEKDLPLTRQIYERINRFMRKRIDKTNALKSTLLLSNSTFTKKNIKKYWGVDRAIACHMGVRTHIFYPEKKKKDIDVLFIGSYDYIDGYGLLVDSLNLLKEKNLNVKYITRETEWISDDSVLRDYYNRAKCMIAFGYKEPFGLIPLEAMACATPVVALNEGGYRDSVIQNKTGFLVPRNPKIIAEKILYLSQNLEVVESLGCAGREQIMEHWTWEKRGEHLKSLLFDEKE